MAQRSQSRLVLLFLVSLAIPAIVLLALGLRLITQERELSEKYAADEQRRRASEVSHQVLARLERLKSRQVTALATQNKVTDDPELVFVGYQDQDKLILPWDQIRTAEESQKLLAAPDFANIIAQGENAEFGQHQFAKAAESYQHAMNTARTPTQVAYAHLLLARALAKSQKQDAAEIHYKELLASPSDLVDEQAIPFSLYAAERLLDKGAERQAIIEVLRAQLSSNRSLPPPQLYFLRDLVDKIRNSAPDQTIRDVAQQLAQEIAGRISNLEQAEELQKEFAGLKLQSSGGPPSSSPPEPTWIAFGKILWLVSPATEIPSSRPVVVVASADQVLARLDSNNGSNASRDYKLTTSADPAGIPMGESFPGLQIVFAANTQSPSGRWSLQRFFYLGALLLVIGITSFGAYLLWRDVQRELQIAQVRSQFASSVSHELKTPLTAIRMFAETLRLGRSTDPRMNAEYLDTIINESERLSRLLNNVLDFSKIEQGKKTYQLTPTSLQEVVCSATRALEYPLAQQGFELHLQVEDSLPPIDADSDALQQAIMNLLTNAMKYSGDSRQIDLRLGRQNGDAVIQVRDCGIGIAAEEQPKIFENFYRVLTPETKSISGTGLGLALISHIVKAHGGHIEVESALGKGSTFSLHLPIEKIR